MHLMPYLIYAQTCRKHLAGINAERALSVLNAVTEAEAMETVLPFTRRIIHGSVSNVVLIMVLSNGCMNTHGKTALFMTP